jgi:hypothetical protein
MNRRSRNLGPIATRCKGKELPPLSTTQYAIEQIERRLRVVEAAHNANGKELKEARIQLNIQALTIRRLQERAQGRDSE